MIILKKIISIGGKYDGSSPEVTVTFHAYSDEWRDGPLLIANQGIAPSIIDGEGKVLGWLGRRQMYRLGNEYDYRIGASGVEVSERKVIDADNEYELICNAAGIRMVPNANRSAIVRWTVKQTFKKPTPRDQEPENEEPSEEDICTFRCTRETIEVPFIRDVRTGKLILNSARDPFSPTPTMQMAIRSYTITRKEKGNPLGKSDLYENVVNSDAWYGKSPGTVLMTSIDPDWDGSVWNVSYNFKWNKNGWSEKYLDTGLRRLVSDLKASAENESGETVMIPVPIIPKGSNTPVQEPVKLDGHGDVLDTTGANGDVGVDLPLAANAYFWKYTELPFATLKLPDPRLLITRPKEPPEPTGGGGTNE